MADFSLHPKQVEFVASTETEVFFGGSRGGSKSHALAYDAAFKWRKSDGGGVKVSIDYPEYRALLVRRKYVDIEMNFKPICDSLYVPYGAYWKERERCYIFPSGAKIILAHCDNRGEVDKYVGGNFHYLGIEEANQFPESWIEMIKSSVRSANPELVPYKRYTSNPGGVGHLWLKRYFYDKCPPVINGSVHNDKYGVDYPNMETGGVYVDEYGNTRKFIPALVFDNPSLLDNDVGYVRNLMSIKDPVLKDMWLFGSWDVQVGAFFGEWNRLYHVVSGDEFRENWKRDRGKYRIFRWIDYGTSNPFVCLFAAVDKDGYVIVFDEVSHTNMSVSVQADMINERMLQWDLEEDDVFLTIVDPAMKIKSLEYEDTPVSPVRMYENKGMRNIMYGNNRRISGAMVVRDFLHVPDDGKPRCVFTDYCRGCIETIPELVRSLNNPEDVDTQGDDHWYDSVRYGLVYVSEAYIPKQDIKKDSWRDKITKVVTHCKKPSCWV
jgi:hypothetical protein